MRNGETTIVPKVCRMWIVMECSIDEKEGQKIYLPAVLVRKKKKGKAKKIILTFLRYIKKCIKPAIKIFSGAIAGLLTAMYLIPEVIEQRGYSAIGGEYLLIILAAFMAIHIADRLIEKR